MPTPKRGVTMDEVEKQFGAPVTRHPRSALAAAAAITRWDYNGFSVVFERDRVIDSVVTRRIGSAAPSRRPAARSPRAGVGRTPAPLRHERRPPLCRSCAPPQYALSARLTHRSTAGGCKNP